MNSLHNQRRHNTAFSGSYIVELHFAFFAVHAAGLGRANPNPGVHTDFKAGRSLGLPRALNLPVVSDF